MAPRDCDLFLPVCFMPDMCPHVLTVSVKLSAVATAIVVIVLLAQGGGGCAVSSLDLQPQMKTGDDIFTFVEVSWDGMESLSL